jgi:ATP-dependent Lon protease
VRRDVALTGEITLSGRVLPVGGVEAKLLGAARAGIRHVVLPRENLDDLGSIPADALAHLVLHGVSDVASALSLALMADADEPPFAIGNRAACGTSPP